MHPCDFCCNFSSWWFLSSRNRPYSLLRSSRDRAFRWDGTECLKYRSANCPEGIPVWNCLMIITRPCARSEQDMWLQQLALTLVCIISNYGKINQLTVSPLFFFLLSWKNGINSFHFFYFSLTLVMHYTALSALLMRHHTSARIQDLLRRVNEETLIGTVSYSDPATGTVLFWSETFDITFANYWQFFGN